MLQSHCCGKIFFITLSIFIHAHSRIQREGLSQSAVAIADITLGDKVGSDRDKVCKHDLCVRSPRSSCGRRGEELFDKQTCEKTTARTENRKSQQATAFEHQEENRCFIHMCV